MIRTAVIGGAGRMGRLLVSYILQDPELTLAAATEAPGHPALGKDAGALAGLDPCAIPVIEDLDAASATADVFIDFSAPESTRLTLEAAARHDCAMVVGTTGLTEQDHERFSELAEKGMRIVLAPNMSVGVNLLFSLCAQVPSILGPDYDIEVVEMHHNRKKDAPSGTAVRLGKILATAAGMDYATDACHGREGNVGARPKPQIGMHAMRGGDVVGDHTVVFATDGERVELTHKASSRETFVKGAMRAVKFIMNAEPGLYDMQDVLGLR